MKPVSAVTGLLAALVFCALGLTGSASAQDSRITAHQIDKSEAYDRALGYSGLQTDLIYIDQLEGEIPMDGAPAYEPPRDRDPSTQSDRQFEITNQVLFGLILAVLIWILWKFGRPVLERFGVISPDVARRRDPQSTAVQETPGDNSDLINSLRRRSDREAALIELIEAILPASAAQNGLRLTRSETARELLRRLPKTWPHLPALRRIVMTEELVQFGGRPLEERSFFDCLDRAAPILRGQGT